MRPNTRMLYIEAPTNPVMEITDITAPAWLAHEHKILLAVDNTFMSPHFQRPIELGADPVIHSTPKYLTGHSDGVGGAVILNDADRAERLQFIQNAGGAILGPVDSWLLLRGVKTLGVRMAKHNENGLTVARYLQAYPKVKEVFYPGLPGHPQHELAKKQMSGFGGMLSFETGSLENAKTLLKSCPPVCAGGKPGRSRNADPSSGDHHPRQPPARRARAHRHHPRTGTNLRRH